MTKSGLKPIRPTLKKGYQVVRAKGKQYSVHRLVARAFLPNPKKLPVVNHKNCNKLDNRVENPEWATQKENILHASKNGRLRTLKTRGKRCSICGELTLREADRCLACERLLKEGGNILNELQIFSNEMFGDIGAVEIDGKPYFVGNDAARALGYANPRDALSKHCKGVAKRDIPTNGGIQEMNVIPEGDLYRLISHSKLPAAEKFEAWVFDVILPTIRRHGAYMSPEVIEKTLSNPDFIINLANQLKEEQLRVARLQPKALSYDKFMNSEGLLTIEAASKILARKGYGEVNLFKFLRDIKAIYKVGRLYYPYQPQIVAKRMAVRAEIMEVAGETYNHNRVYLTPKGFGWLEKKLNAARVAV